MQEHEQYLLRQMKKEDLEQVLQWRNSERIRQSMYTDHIISESEHLAWFLRVMETKSSYHYVFEYDHNPIGVVNVNGINQYNMTCHWGFYLGEITAPRGTATVMGIMAIDEIFYDLKMRKIIGEAIASNSDSITYHLRLGFAQEGILREQILKNNVPTDVVTFGLIEHEWKTKQPLLKQKYIATTRVE